ncbi:MAG: protein-L-isoaspartate(D-aspartate) O-methyltransferase [Desulfobacca sp.]|uniref:protein-L-isoaspartate(D-aspartate) O-methyltransferase n=1 Tax=Desulfobacca sp. TaxID=2067990 RepID=UPI004049A7F2
MKVCWCWLCLWLGLLLLAGAVLAGADPDKFAEARRRMLEWDLKGRDITDARVLAAMAAVPRHRFVPVELERQAYDDTPLPIGHGATISQPYIVALMTQAALIQPGQRVLEVGTGSGYQAAILAQLTDQVYSIELVPQLAQAAAERLARLGYSQVRVKTGDGYQGWPEHAPFDAILVTAAAPEVPAALKEQLKDGGRLVIPVGPVFGPQYLLRLTKQGATWQEEVITPVAFVPLVKPRKSAP